MKSNVVYFENRQFFKDLNSIPMPTERSVDKETINEAVYGKKWRDRIHKCERLNQNSAMGF